MQKYAEGDLIFRRYRVEAMIKAGGMGAVYRVVDHQFPDRGLLAFKEMLADFSGATRDLVAQKFREEAAMLVRLEHPAIPRVWDYFVEDDAHCIVMAYIEGSNLEQVLEEHTARTGHPLPERDVVEYAIQLCDVLSFLHGQPHPVIHRDIKPSNVIERRRRTGEPPQVVLVDFGLARHVDTRTQTAVGTLGYAPLEQFKGQSEARSDLYALGATMHHLLTGQQPQPFQVPPVLDVSPDVHPRLAALIDRCLQEDVNARPPTARDMKRELMEILPQASRSPSEAQARRRREDEETALLAPVVDRTVVQPPAPATRRVPVKPLAIALLVLAVAVVTALGLRARQPDGFAMFTDRDAARSRLSLVTQTGATVDGATVHLRPGGRGRQAGIVFRRLSTAPPAHWTFSFDTRGRPDIQAFVGNVVIRVTEPRDTYEATLARLDSRDGLTLTSSPLSDESLRLGEGLRVVLTDFDNGKVTLAVAGAERMKDGEPVGVGVLHADGSSEGPAFGFVVTGRGDDDDVTLVGVSP